jgi:competence protein ComEC
MDKKGGKNVYRGMCNSVFSIFPVLGLWLRRIAAFLALCAVFSACMYAEEGSDHAGLRVSFLDVGQGLAVLLEEDGRYALYDTGPDSAGLVDTLAARGVRELEWVLVSHAHRDHGGGFMEFAHAVESGALRVGRLYVGPDTYAGIVRDSVLRLASRLKVPVDTVARGDVLGMCGQDGAGGGSGAASPGAPVSRLDVLWPPKGDTLAENAASVVALLEYGGYGVLLTADLDSAGERRLLEYSPSLRAHILQVPHHGSAGSSTIGFLSQVAPQYAVVSVGAKNAYGHPAAPVMRKLLYVVGDSSAVYRTDQEGSVTFELLEGVGIVPDIGLK